MGQALVVPKLDLEGFLAWECEQPERHEWVDGEIFAMTGARDAHNRLAGNVYIAVRAALRGTPCRTFMSDMKLHVAAADAVFYPDVFVTCDPRDRTAEADLVKRHPGLIVEVISESTGAYDRGRKFELYRTLPSLQEVLFLEQDRMQADLFRRNEEGRWELFPATPEGELALSSVPVTLRLAELYGDVLNSGEAA
jgi:Uma2 family endonuclease